MLVDFLRKCETLYPTPSPSTAVAITVACGTWEASFDLLLQLDGPRFAGLSEVVSDYPSWTIPSITSMNSFECNKRCPLRIQRLSSNWRWTCAGWLAVWSWYFGFVIRRPRLCSCKWFARGEFLSNNDMSLKCAWIYVLFGSATRTGTKMGSGTHSCRYLLQSNQYCNLFGLAKWISVNLNQTKCNATW